MQNAGKKKDALSALFRFLAAQRVEYCVVGRATPDDPADRSDVDLIVPPAELRRVHALLPALASTLGVPLLRRIPHAQGWRFDFAWRDAANRTILLPLDFIGDLTWRGRRIVAAADLLTAARLEGQRGGAEGGRRSPPASEFSYLFAKRLLKRQLDGSAGDYLSSLWRADGEAARQATDRRFKRTHAALIAAAAEHGDWAEVRERLPGLRAALLQRAPLSSTALVGAGAALARRLVRPVGLVVRLAGDGASGTRAATLLSAAEPIFDRTLAITALDPHEGRWRVAVKAHATRLRNGLVVVDEDSPGAAPSGLWRRLLPRPDVALALGEEPFASAAQAASTAVAPAGSNATEAEPGPLRAAMTTFLLDVLRQRAARRSGATV